MSHPLIHDSFRSIAINDVYGALEKVGDHEVQMLFGKCAKKDTTAYPLSDTILSFSNHPLLDKVQKKVDVEVDIRRLKKLRSSDPEKKDIYIGQKAKVDLRADSKGVPLDANYVEHFLKTKQLLLVLGSSGSGKSTFLRHFEAELWKQYLPDSDSRIPLFISLPSIDRPAQMLIEKHLKVCEFSPPAIRAMKSRKFVIFCDGFDEGHYHKNLHKSNDFLKNGWDVKMVISCRTESLGEDYHKDFEPESTSSDPDPLQQAILEPFGDAEINHYIEQYVTNKNPSWEVSHYKDVLEELRLSELLTNPFMMTLALDVLPRIRDPRLLPVKTIRRVELYDEFMDQWLEQSKDRLRKDQLSIFEEHAFESLKEGNFFLRCREYLQGLSTAIYENQDGDPVVKYSRSRDNTSWKEDFFGRKDHEILLLRKACPIKSHGSHFRFSHRSLLEYSVSLAIFSRKEDGLSPDAPKENKTTRPKKKDYRSFKPDVQSSEIKLDVKDKSPLITISFVGEQAVLQFLVDRLHIEAQSAADNSETGSGSHPLRAQLRSYVEASKHDPTYGIAAANAITILVRAKIPFKCENLEKIKIPGADLSLGMFDSANFQGADLTDTIFRAAW